MGATTDIPALPGAYGAYQVTLLQVYWNLTYLSGEPGAHPFVARLRISDTGSAGLDEDPQQDAATLLLEQDYPTWPVEVSDSRTIWELLAGTAPMRQRATAS
jgi:hypothetical protein